MIDVEMGDSRNDSRPNLTHVATVQPTKTSCGDVCSKFLRLGRPCDKSHGMPLKCFASLRMLNVHRA